MSCFFTVIVIAWGFLVEFVSGSKLLINVKEAGPTGLRVELEWLLSKNFSSVAVSWESINYSSEITSRFIKLTEVNPSSNKLLVSEGLKLNQQYRFCVTGSNLDCPREDTLCSYVKVPKYNKVHGGPHLYLVFGPIFSTNITISWFVLPKGSLPAEPVRSDVGYRLHWVRVDGRIGGHPGHSSNVVSQIHYIKGLMPATRFEICVGETLNRSEFQSCDLITTEEDLPGPPIADVGTCYNQARGTHWRCDITWWAPRKKNGKIQGYSVSWRDQEGFSLLESSPRGALCDPLCVDDQILTFHPHEVCVRAKTSKGYGWESCTKINDVSGRILAFFEFKVLLIILSTVLVYKFGTQISAACFRCCIRNLYTRLESTKEHPV